MIVKTDTDMLVHGLVSALDSLTSLRTNPLEIVNTGYLKVRGK